MPATAGRGGRIMAKARADGTLATFAHAVSEVVGWLDAKQLQQLDADLGHEQADVLRHLTRITLLREKRPEAARTRG
jgi:hypothetical protein